uniref:Protein kinase domain-containing protein n=1 Tax=Quercus lobata TaxID=97700 RepID=A0A7N2LZK2_QUELO
MFILCKEVLSRLINRALQEGSVKEVSIARHVLQLLTYYIVYANDELLFWGAKKAEFVPTDLLYKHLSCLFWKKQQVKDCKGNCSCNSYLHTAFSRPIIHRNIQLENIFLDQNNVAKLTEFSLSISIPKGETHAVVDYLGGTAKFICPKYFSTFHVMEIVDVYSFRSFLLELLTGRRPTPIRRSLVKKLRGQQITMILAESFIEICCMNGTMVLLKAEWFPLRTNGSLADRLEVSNSSLNGEQQQRESMAWQSKLKIAREIAHAIVSPHCVLKTIIHRDIKQGNIFLDEHDVAKLTDFSESISIPDDEIHVVDKHVIGTLGFVCPYYGTTCRITEKIDVFSFGSFLLELTTGQRIYHLVETADDEGVELEDYIENVTINEIVNLAIQARERGAVVEQQAQAVKLALLCREKDPEIRPNMVYVTKEPRMIEREKYLEIRPNMVDITKELRKIERFIPLPPSKFLCKESILE